MVDVPAHALRFAEKVSPLIDTVLLLGIPAILAIPFLLAWRHFRRRQRASVRPIVIDGSNVMHWNGGKPSIDTVRAVVEELASSGFFPGVVFDANAGHLLAGRYLHDGALARAVGLPRDRVMVVPKGTPADPYILAAARDMGAPIVTNDRYRDWATDFPEIGTPGHLVRGRCRAGVVTLKLTVSSPPAT